MHTHNDYPELEHQPVDKETLRNYVSVAKSFDPVISDELTEYIVGTYVKLREDADENPDIQYTGARTLLAVLRKSNTHECMGVLEVLRLITAENGLKKVLVMLRMSAQQQGGCAFMNIRLTVNLCFSLCIPCDILNSSCLEFDHEKTVTRIH